MRRHRWTPAWAAVLAISSAGCAVYLAWQAHRLENVLHGRSFSFATHTYRLEFLLCLEIIWAVVGVVTLISTPAHQTRGPARTTALLASAIAVVVLLAILVVGPYPGGGLLARSDALNPNPIKLASLASGFVAVLCLGITLFIKTAGRGD